jgi:uncharacterized protein
MGIFLAVVQSCQAGLMFTTTNLLLGVAAALFVGLSKTALPGGGLLAAPIFATIVSGRLIAGATLPILLVADVFAVRWFGKKCRQEVLRPMIVPVTIGFAGGAAFFAVLGSGGRSLRILIGVTVLLLVAIQSFRLIGRRPPTTPTRPLIAAVGVTGGFVTFVANAAGPVINTYFSGLGMPKEELVGTSGVFYFTVNLAKIPVYLLIGALTAGGSFFTRESLLFDLVLVPAVIAGVFSGRWLLPRISPLMFNVLVLVMAAGAAVKLLLDA